MRGKVILLLMTVITSFTVACTPVLNSDDKINSSLIEDICKFLTSEQCGGRLTGTAGNSAVENFISEKFENIKLNSYDNGSFKLPYKHEYIDFENSKMTMELIYEDGSKTSCKYGEDFLLQNNISEINLKLPVIKAENANSAKAEEYALIIDENEQYPVGDKHLKAILVKHRLLSRNVLLSESGIPIVQISEDLYNAIVNKKDTTMNFQSELIKENVTANNIVGIIEGENHDNALVISAHFDHVGQVGNKLFSGAMDNASGVSILVDLADKFMSNKIGDKVDYDIILCAFNGEESGLQGSKAFANGLSARYKKIIDINLDCLGKKKSQGLLISGAEGVNRDLMDSLSAFFTSMNYKVEIDKDALYASDHITFNEIGQPSVNISSLEAFQKDRITGISTIHTSRDAYENLDIASLNKISKELYEYIVGNAGEQFMIEPGQQVVEGLHNEEEDRINAFLEQEQRKLTFNQYKLVAFGDQHYIVQNSVGIFNDRKSLEKLLPNSKIGEKLNGYIFKDAMLGLDIDKLNIKDIEVDKVYEGGKINLEDVVRFKAQYMDAQNQNDNIAIQMTRLKKNDNHTVDYGIDTIVKELDIAGLKYNVVCLNQTNQIFAIGTIANIDNEYWAVDIQKYVTQGDGKTFKPNWTVASNEEIAQFINELQIPQYINDILLSY